jgi:hypothetical protein
MRKIVIGLAIVLLALSMTSPMVQVRAEEVWQTEDAIPVINFQNGYDKIKQYLQTTSTMFQNPLGYPNDKIVAVGTQYEAYTIWPNRDEYGIIYFAYHALNNNPYLVTFLDDVGEELIDRLYQLAGSADMALQITLRIRCLTG